MASLWYCCGCRFGPHNSALYDACIQCGVRRCYRCMDQKLSQCMASHGCHTVSPYPGVIPLDTPHTVSLETRTMPVLSGLADLPGAPSLVHPENSVSSPPAPSIMQFYSQTYMYICCKCHDGPKVYNHQPRCVMCSHVACSSCTYVK